MVIPATGVPAVNFDGCDALITQLLAQTFSRVAVCMWQTNRVPADLEVEWLWVGDCSTLDSPSTGRIDANEVSLAQFNIEVVDRHPAEVIIPTAGIPTVNLDDITALAVDLLTEALGCVGGEWRKGQRDEVPARLEGDGSRDERISD